MSGEQITLPMAEEPVDVSFVVACYNAGAYLEPAIRSALAQVGVAVEVLVVDDGSTDGSRELVARLVGEDRRISLLVTPLNSGPAGARNIGLGKLRGRWYAVLDADDVIDPERSRTLIGLADRVNAAMVADNVIEFGSGIREHKMFSIAPANGAAKLGLEEYLSRSRLFSREPGPGYLKPMIRAAALRHFGLRYNEALRIAEDDELVIRALVAGLDYVVCDYAGYRYRRHGSSISHRLSLSDLEKMMVAEREVERILPDAIRRASAYRARLQALKRGHTFLRSIEALKSGAYSSAARMIARDPGALPLYAMPLGARLRRVAATLNRLR